MAETEFDQSQRKETRVAACTVRPCDDWRFKCASTYILCLSRSETRSIQSRVRLGAALPKSSPGHWSIEGLAIRRGAMARPWPAWCSSASHVDKNGTSGGRAARNPGGRQVCVAYVAYVARVNNADRLHTGRPRGSPRPSTSSATTIVIFIIMFITMLIIILSFRHALRRSSARRLVPSVSVTSQADSFVGERCSPKGHFHVYSFQRLARLRYLVPRHAQLA